MARVRVLFFTKTGNVGTMARAVADGVRVAGGEATLASVEEVQVNELLDDDAVVIGTPVYYGLPAAPVKAFLDETSALHGRLRGRVGGAFASSVNRAGGNETAILAVLQAMLVHGMVIQGASQGDHYGPVAVGAPDEQALVECRELGARVTRLADRLLAGKGAED